MKDDKNNPVGDAGFSYEGYEGASRKWRSRKEFKTIDKVRSRFREMQQARRNSCPFPSPKDMVEAADLDVYMNNAGGYSWEDMWEYNWNLYTMKRQYITGRSNLKSSTSLSPVEAAVAEFSDVEIGALLNATEPEDASKVTVIKNLLKHLHKKGDFKNANIGSFTDAAIYGTSFIHHKRVQKVRDVEIIINTASNAKAELEKILKGAKEDDKERLVKRLEGGKPLTKKERIIEYDDIARVHKSIFEIYVDPDARCMRGFEYEATDLVDRSIPSLAQFRSEFEHTLDPFVIKENVKKVRGASVTAEAYQGGTAFFSLPNDMIDKANNVELLRYYNKRTDKYIVIANDILVREGPLPLNHKQIPYTARRYLKLTHSFYGLGIPYLLEGIQAEDETLRNMMIEQLKINLNPPLLVRKDFFEGDNQLDDFWEAGKIIEVAGDVGAAAKWMDGSAPRFDYFQARGNLNEEAIKTVGINSIAFSQPQPNQPVRNNMMTMESTQKMIRKAIVNWAEGEKDAIRQEIAMMRQIYPESYLKNFDGKENKDKQFKSIRMEGTKLIPYFEEDEKGGKMLKGVEQQESRSDDNWFEVREEYFDLVGDIDVEIDMSSFPLISQALKLQKIQEFMGAMVPFWQNPMLLTAPGATETIKTFVRELGVENAQKIIDELTVDDEDSINDAAEQLQRILNGEEVPGIPGEPMSHKLEHVKAFLDLMGKMSDPEMAMEQLQEIEGALTRLHKHMEVDDKPKFAAMSVLSQHQMQPPMGAMPPQGQPPMMGPDGMPMDPAMMDQMMMGAPAPTGEPALGQGAPMGPA